MKLFDFLKPNVEKMKAKKNVKGLIKVLGHRDYHLRASAAFALGETGDARAVEPLIASLKDSASFVCIYAAGALGKIGDARGVEPLIAIFKDVRLGMAARALDEIGNVRAVAPLIEALSDTRICALVATALGKIGDARAVEPLLATLAGSEGEGQNAAAQALKRIGDPRANQAIAEWEKRQQEESRRRQEERLKQETEVPRLYESGNMVRAGYGCCALCGKKMATDISLTSRGALVCNRCGLSVCWGHDKKQIMNQKCPKCGAAGMWQTHTAVYR